MIKWISLLFIVGSIISCSNNESSKEPEIVTNRVDEETSQMKRELAEIAKSTNPLDMWHQNEAQAKYYENILKTTDDPGQKVQLAFKAGNQWLNAGNFERAIKMFNAIIKAHEAKQINLNASTIKQFYELLAVSYLRKGEVENCVKHHNSASCILPLLKEGQHQLREGSEKALAIYEKLLEEYPNDLQIRWLYNLAMMTVGKHPQDITKGQLIPNSIFNSDYELKAFKDIAAKSGVAVNDISGGCVVDDFNNDGLLDIMSSSYGINDQIRLFINKGNNSFKETTDQSNLIGIVSGLNLLQADYNNDGHLDVLVLRGAWLGKGGLHPNSLLKNNGDGTFSDVTRSSGIYSKKPTQTACWGDFNNDGLLDLFIGNESSNTNPQNSELFVNQGDGTFKEQSKEFGLSFNVFVKGSVWGDIDNDGDLDLYISNLYGKNLLFENLGKEANYNFRNIADKSGVEYPLSSFPCWFWDVNNDGYLDIYVNSFSVSEFTTASNFVTADYLGMKVDSELPKLYINQKNGTFAESAQDYNIDKVLYTMGCNFGDIDNDGYQDFYASTGTPDFRAVFPNRMFRNNRGQAFQDVTTSTRTGHIQKGHGVGFGDIDNDGDQDMYVVLGGSYSGDNFMNSLFENDNEDNNWISIKLEGQTFNKSAIGAKIQIVTELPDGSTQNISRVVNSGASFGASSLRSEIGLAKATKIKTIKVDWPGFDSQEFNNIIVNQHYSLRQGDKQLKTRQF